MRYIRVVDSVNNNSFPVSYMERSDKGGAKCLCSDEVEIHSKDISQMILRHIQVVSILIIKFFTVAVYK